MLPNGHMHDSSQVDGVIKVKEECPDYINPDVLETFNSLDLDNIFDDDSANSEDSKETTIAIPLNCHHESNIDMLRNQVEIKQMSNAPLLQNAAQLFKDEIFTRRQTRPQDKCTLKQGLFVNEMPSESKNNLDFEETNYALQKIEYKNNDISIQYNQSSVKPEHKEKCNSPEMCPIPKLFSSQRKGEGRPFNGRFLSSARQNSPSNLTILNHRYSRRRSFSPSPSHTTSKYSNRRSRERDRYSRRRQLSSNRSPTIPKSELSRQRENSSYSRRMNLSARSPTIGKSSRRRSRQRERGRSFRRSLSSRYSPSIPKRHRYLAPRRSPTIHRHLRNRDQYTTVQKSLSSRRHSPIPFKRIKHRSSERERSKLPRRRHLSSSRSSERRDLLSRTCSNLKYRSHYNKSSSTRRRSGSTNRKRLNYKNIDSSRESCRWRQSRSASSTFSDSLRRYSTLSRRRIRDYSRERPTSHISRRTINERDRGFQEKEKRYSSKRNKIHESSSLIRRSISPLKSFGSRYLRIPRSKELRSSKSPTLSFRSHTKQSIRSRACSPNKNSTQRSKRTCNTFSDELKFKKSRLEDDTEDINLISKSVTPGFEPASSMQFKNTQPIFGASNSMSPVVLVNESHINIQRKVLLPAPEVANMPPADYTQSAYHYGMPFAYHYENAKVMEPNYNYHIQGTVPYGPPPTLPPSDLRHHLERVRSQHDLNHHYMACSEYNMLSRERVIKTILPQAELSVLSADQKS